MHHTDHQHTVEFDVAYIDMMIPHHESLVALSQEATTKLTQPHLVALAASFVTTQERETEQMTRLRREWYGDAPKVSMDAMMQQMPGMGDDMDEMHNLMSAEWMVQAFRDAGEKNIAFIDQTVPHHQMAVDASKDAVEKAIHPELATIARDVIASQQRDIDALKAIRAELTGTAMPES